MSTRLPARRAFLCTAECEGKLRSAARARCRRDSQHIQASHGETQGVLPVIVEPCRRNSAAPSSGSWLEQE